MTDIRVENTRSFFFFLERFLFVQFCGSNGFSGRIEVKSLDSRNVLDSMEIKRSLGCLDHIQEDFYANLCLSEIRKHESMKLIWPFDRPVPPSHPRNPITSNSFISSHHQTDFDHRCIDSAQLYEENYPKNNIYLT